MRGLMRFSILGSLLAMAAAGGLGCESKQASEQSYCQSLSAVKEGLDKVAAMGPDTTIQEVTSVADKLQKDTSTAAKEARRIGSPAARELAAAADHLEADTRNFPANATVAQVVGKIAADGQHVKDRARALASESGCPNAISMAEPAR